MSVCSIFANDVDGPTGLVGGIVEYPGNNHPWVLDAAVDALACVDPDAASKMGPACGVLKIPNLATDGLNTMYHAGKAVSSFVACDWTGVVAHGHKCSEKLAWTVYDASCVARFAEKTMGVQGLPSLGKVGVVGAAYGSLNSICRHVVQLINSTPVVVTSSGDENSQARALHDGKYRKNMWQLAESILIFASCVLFLVGVVLSAGWTFVISLAGMILSFGAYIEQREIQNNEQVLIGRVVR